MSLDQSADARLRQPRQFREGFLGHAPFSEVIAQLHDQHKCMSWIYMSSIHMRHGAFETHAPCEYLW